jgi:hypothetical protein
MAQPSPGPVPVPYPLAEAGAMTEPAPATDSVGRVPFPCWPPIKCLLKISGPGQLQIGAGPSGSTGEQIEVLAWSWGSLDTMPPDPQSSDPQEGGEVVGGVDSVGTAQAKRRKGGAGSAALGDMPVTKKLDKSSPVVLTRPAGEPGKVEVPNLSAGAGTVTLLVPAGTCVQGASYPAVTLRSEGKAYELQDATVAECGPETLARGKMAQKEKLKYLQVTMKEIIVTN